MSVLEESHVLQKAHYYQLKRLVVWSLDFHISSETIR